MATDAVSGRDEAAAPEKKRRRWIEKRPAIWHVVGFILLPLLSLLSKYRIKGAHNIPSTGAFVLAPNHYTEFDPLVAGYTLYVNKRVPRFLAKGGLFKVPVFGWILRATGQIPVQRGGGGGHESLAAATRLTDEGLAVVIYPEGTLTRDPDMWPMRGKTGAVRMALEHDVPLIPMAQWGAQAILARYGKRIHLFGRHPIDVLVGEPVDLSPWRGKTLDATTLAEATDAVMQAITALLEQIRDEKAPAERWDPATHGQTETGRF